MNLGNTIYRLREAKGYNQKTIAEKSNITQAYLSQIENNKKLPNLATLSTLSEILNTPLPIIFFLSIDENDLPEKKKEMFKSIQPLINNLIKEVFIDNE